MKYLALLGLFLFGGCATLKADVKAVADVCRPELLPDAEAALPYLATYLVCEIQHADCTSALNDLEALGHADALACAAAELHAGTVAIAPKP